VPGIEEQSGGQRSFPGQAAGVGAFSPCLDDILAFQRALQQQSGVPAQDILQIGGEGRRSIGTRAMPVQGRKTQIAALWSIRRSDAMRGGLIAHTSRAEKSLPSLPISQESRGSQGAATDRFDPESGFRPGRSRPKRSLFDSGRPRDLA
jgi:hypothetical protein